MATTGGAKVRPIGPKFESCDPNLFRETQIPCRLKNRSVLHTSKDPICPSTAAESRPILRSILGSRNPFSPKSDCKMQTPTSSASPESTPQPAPATNYAAYSAFPPFGHYPGHVVPTPHQLAGPWMMSP